MAKKIDTSVLDIKIEKVNNGYLIKYLEHSTQSGMFGGEYTVDMVDKVNVFQSWDDVIEFLQENELAA
jgi:hypothetical protein